MTRLFVEQLRHRTFEVCEPHRIPTEAGSDRADIAASRVNGCVGRARFAIGGLMEVDEPGLVLVRRAKPQRRAAGAARRQRGCVSPQSGSGADETIAGQAPGVLQGRVDHGSDQREHVVEAVQRIVDDVVGVGEARIDTAARQRDEFRARRRRRPSPPSCACASSPLCWRAKACRGCRCRAAARPRSANGRSGPYCRRRKAARGAQ